MVLHGIARHCTILHGIAWYCMVLHWYSWSGSESESPVLLYNGRHAISEKVGGGWISSRSGWLLELLTELKNHGQPTLTCVCVWGADYTPGANQWGPPAQRLTDVTDKVLKTGKRRGYLSRIAWCHFFCRKKVVHGLVLMARHLIFSSKLTCEWGSSFQWILKSFTKYYYE